MSAPIGALRTRVTLERPFTAGDGAGGGGVTWQEVALLWARVTPRSGAETTRIGGLSGAAAYDIAIRWRPGVEPAMRFRLGARLFTIEAALPDERRRFINCRCEERDL